MNTYIITGVMRQNPVVKTITADTAATAYVKFQQDGHKSSVTIIKKEKAHG